MSSGVAAHEFVPSFPVQDAVDVVACLQSCVVYFVGDFARKLADIDDVEDFIIFDNLARYVDGQGGGVYLNGSDSTLSDNTITTNTASHDGGGVYLNDSDATLTGNTFRKNTANDDGGGLYLYSSNATLSNNAIVSNTATGITGGGGLYVTCSDATLTANTIISNTASDNGGGLYLIGSSYWGTTLNGNTQLFGAG